MITCINCNFKGTGKFCSNCGQHLKYERIKFSGILHEVVHTFTHFEEKFLFTVKQLAIRPGFMQKNYLNGYRARDQKPFPMFVVCATVCSLVMYFIYRDSPANTGYTYKHYWVFAHTAMLPFYAFTTWIFFKSSRLYYAEALVLNIYMLGFMLLIILPANLLQYFFSELVISIIEVIILVSYTTWTYLNFFDNKPVWIVVIKSFFCLVINYFLLNTVINKLIYLLA